ncbi:MAG: 2-C-methyl-D-erythritol 2,4-cyclodiphosphate synthase [Phycisphaerae bacterium]|nr:2-C-methyl-D-erythritol 2,4-cyclodiphosphate synthase [Phycisphaerae bacterium]
MDCPYRIGHGHDVHRVLPGGRLVLGGVEVPCDFGLLGHSDADVVLHALMDALLGAAGLGDIGEFFPDSDAAFLGADSRELLRQIVERVVAAGFVVVNVDLMIHAERPKLAAYKPAIRTSIAEAIGISADRVNIKAGTNEGLDAVGRGLGIACDAVALLAVAETR